MYRHNLVFSTFMEIDSWIYAIILDTLDGSIHRFIPIETWHIFGHDFFGMAGDSGVLLGVNGGVEWVARQDPYVLIFGSASQKRSTAVYNCIVLIICI